MMLNGCVSSTLYIGAAFVENHYHFFFFFFFFAYHIFYLSNVNVRCALICCRIIEQGSSTPFQERCDGLV